MTGFLIVAPLGLIAAAVVVAWLESDAPDPPPRPRPRSKRPPRS